MVQDEPKPGVQAQAPHVFEDQSATPGFTSILSEERYTKEDEKTLRLLDKRVTLSTENILLRAAIDFIRIETGVDVSVNKPALELVGIDGDTLVSVDVNDKPAWVALKLALDAASADAFDDDKAGFAIYGGVVMISTRRDLKLNTMTHVYDISWFIYPEKSIHQHLYNNANDKARLKQPRFELNDALSGTSSGGNSKGGGGGGLFGGEDTSEE